MTSESGVHRPAPWARLTWIVIVGLGLIVVGLTLFAASGGVRGSDQYWYLADVQTLIRDRVIATNTVFPVRLLGPESSLPPPFIHNILGIYLAALPALVFGSYAGWIVLNIAATLATSFLIYLAARTVAHRWAALLCGVGYALLPITLWQTAQPLVEASISLFAALVVYLVAVAGTSGRRWFAVLAAVGLVYLSRQSYLPLLVAVPIGFFVTRARVDHWSFRGSLGSTLVLAVAAVVIGAVGQIAFAVENVQPSYSRLIHTAVPGQTDNMWFNFDLSPANLADRLPIDLGLLASKVGGHLAEQFFSFESAPVALFYWTFNALALIAVATLWRERNAQRIGIILAALAMVAVHFMTIVLFQNQFRYTLPALPGLLVVLAMVLSDRPALDRLVAPRTLLTLAVVTLVAAGPDVLLARTLRADGVANATVERAATDLLDRNVAVSDSILIVYVNSPHVLAYAARPRLILYLSAEYTAADLERLLAAFPTRWVLAPVESPTIAKLGIPTGGDVGTFHGPGGQWGLFALPRHP